MGREAPAPLLLQVSHSHVTLPGHELREIEGDCTDRRHRRRR